MLSLFVLLTILGAMRASAQQVRGVVRDSTAGTPLAGAIVLQLDSAGRNGARAITDADGHFAITLARSTVRLRIMRIGYHPAEVALSANRTPAIDVAMRHLPPMLDVMRVTGSELCPDSPAQGAAFEIWEQARTGLLATIVARELEPARAAILTYTTNLSPNNLRVRRQTATVQKGNTTRPFAASATPSFFARVGYMLEDGPTRIFNAPDADVLIDESFAATHCFRLRNADGTHPGQVGLAFAPVDGRDTLVDVQGVIWIDAATPQLRSLDFTYTSLEPASMQAHAGGHIDFRNLSNGVSFIERWKLRMPLLDVPPGGVHRNTMSIAKVRRTDLVELKLKELFDAGGMVLDASWPDGARFTALRSTVSGVVVGKGSGKPVVGAIVRLVGTPDTVRTDTAGHFRIETIPGNYVIEATDTTFATFVESRSQSTPVDLRLGAEATVRLEVRPFERVIDDVCHGQSMRVGSGMITGALALKSGELPRDAYIEATFQGITTGEVINEKQKASFDDHGRFVVCGTPRDRKVHLTLKTSTRTVADTSVIVGTNEASHRVLWVVSRP